MGSYVNRYRIQHERRIMELGGQLETLETRDNETREYLRRGSKGAQYVQLVSTGGDIPSSRLKRREAGHSVYDITD